MIQNLVIISFAHSILLANLFANHTNNANAKKKQTLPKFVGM